MLNINMDYDKEWSKYNLILNIFFAKQYGLE